MSSAGPAEKRPPQVIWAGREGRADLAGFGMMLADGRWRMADGGLKISLRGLASGLTIPKSKIPNKSQIPNESQIGRAGRINGLKTLTARTCKQTAATAINPNKNRPATYYII
jgi:hypothetical protein